MAVEVQHPRPVHGDGDHGGTCGTTTVLIHPGDLLAADVHGVVHIPQDMVSKVMALIPSQVAADQRIAHDLSNGRPFAEAAREHRASVREA